MTVKDLINHLRNNFEMHERVHFQYNYGDHGRTQVCPEVESVEMGRVEYSEYHQMPARVREHGAKMEPGHRHVVIIR